MTKLWTQAEAIQLCWIVEKICPTFGCHVALTGGTLYKEGPRKDVDLLFYCIRQVDRLDQDGLIDALRKLGFTICAQHGWVIKALYEGKQVDLFFPEAYPSSSGSTDEYRNENVFEIALGD
jgi:hypothetical protein